MIVFAIAVLVGIVALTYLGYKMMLTEKKITSNAGHTTKSLDAVIAVAPAVRIDVTEGAMESTPTGVTYINGTALVSVLDDDANITESFDVKFEQFDIPVPAGMSAAADVDGLKHAMVYMIRGELDSVDFEYSSGARAATQSL
jgi:hypothetical protein